MIKNIISGSVDYISDIINDGINLPYRTVHFLNFNSSKEDNDVNEFLNEVLECEIKFGAITREQANDYLLQSENSFQSVIVFYNYKVLDKFKVGDFVHVIFNEYEEPLSEDSCFCKSVLKVGLHVTRDFKDSNKRLHEYINSEVEEYNI